MAYIPHLDLDRGKTKIHGKNLKKYFVIFLKKTNFLSLTREKSPHKIPKSHPLQFFMRVKTFKNKMIFYFRLHDLTKKIISQHPQIFQKIHVKTIFLTIIVSKKQLDSSATSITNPSYNKKILAIIYIAYNNNVIPRQMTIV